MVGKTKKNIVAINFRYMLGSYSFIIKLIRYLPPGDYAFPFSIWLQQNLPGSFNLKNQFLKAQIKYKAKAEMESTN